MKVFQLKNALTRLPPYKGQRRLLKAVNNPVFATGRTGKRFAIIPADDAIFLLCLVR